MRILTTLLASLASLILTACGPGRDTAFNPYVAAFEDAAQVQGHPASAQAISIHFGQLPNGTAGECRGGSEIVISPGSWDSASPERREVLIFHELGHCALGRQHLEAFVPMDGIQLPASIMWAGSLDGDTYARHRAYYQAELFSPR